MYKINGFWVDKKTMVLPDALVLIMGNPATWNHSTSWTILWVSSNATANRGLLSHTAVSLRIGITELDQDHALKPLFNK